MKKQPYLWREKGGKSYWIKRHMFRAYQTSIFPRVLNTPESCKSTFHCKTCLESTKPRSETTFSRVFYIIVVVENLDISHSFRKPRGRVPFWLSCTSSTYNFTKRELHHRLYFEKYPGHWTISSAIIFVIFE